MVGGRAESAKRPWFLTTFRERGEGRFSSENARFDLKNEKIQAAKEDSPVRTMLALGP
jgi:hypothetical protein